MSGSVVDVVVTGLPEVRERLASVSLALRQHLLPRVEQLSIRLRDKVQSDKLTGQVLHVRTGNLRRSINYRVDDLGDAGVAGNVFQSADVRYGRIHEFGGTTKAHDILPRKAEALRFMIGGKAVFAKIVHHPGSKMPERSFMRSSLADMRDEIIATLKTATQETLGS